MHRIDWVLPAYNPSSGWASYAVSRLREIQAAFPEYIFHLYVVTDGSQRGHGEEERQALREFFADRLTYVEYTPNRGKGFALRSAISHTEADYVVYTDWDFPFTPESYLQAVERLIKGDVDLVLPQRNRVNYLQHLSPMRRFLSQGSFYLNRLFLALPANDTQGGIKAFNRRGREVFLATTIDRFLFDTEFVALCTRRGLRIDTTSCEVRPEIELSGMGWRTIRGELKNFNQLIRARWFS